MTENVKVREGARLEMLLLMLMGIVILLMVAIAGLFVHMNKVHKEVLEAVAPLRAAAQAQAEMMEQMDGLQGLEIGTVAPSFVLADTNGTQVSLGDFSDQTMLVFSSTRCRACTEMYPELARFSQNQGAVQIVMMSIGTTEEARQLVDAQGFTFPVLPIPGWTDDVVTDYQINGVPFFYVIEGNGAVVAAGTANTQTQIEKLVRQAEK